MCKGHRWKLLLDICMIYCGGTEMVNRNDTMINKATWTQEYHGKHFCSTVSSCIQKCKLTLHYMRKKPYSNTVLWAEAHLIWTETD